jgi:hypothetical protein
MEIQPGSNTPDTIDGRDYSGHALDRMQGRGIPPRVVEDAIQNNPPEPGDKPGTTQYYDADNNVRVIVNSQTGRVVTVF